MAKSQQKFNIYQHVTDAILADLEAVTAPSRLPDLGRGRNGLTHSHPMYPDDRLESKRVLFEFLSPGWGQKRTDSRAGQTWMSAVPQLEK